MDLRFIDSVLEKHDSDKSKIIAIMQDVQEQYRYLPQEALEYIAEKVGMSESKLYGVATFYGNFSLDAKGKYVMKVCRGTACHVRKSSNVLQALYDATGTSEQKAYLANYLQKVEDAIYGDDFRDADGVRWSDYMDIISTAKYWWVQEFMANSPDAFWTPSTS